MKQDYELALWKTDKKIYNYLDADTQIKPEGKSIRIHYAMSSCKGLPDTDIHRFLSWRHYSPEQILTASKKVARKSFTDLLIIWDSLMNAIFEIITESSVMFIYMFLFFLVLFFF